MDRIGDQIVEMAWTLVSDTERRRQFVAQNRIATQRLREKFAREREQVQRDIERQAQDVASSLKASTVSIKREVARTLSSLHQHRTRSGLDETAARRQFVSRVRRHVSGNLQRQRTRREWVSRQQTLEVAHTLQRLRRRVRELRGESSRMTAATAAQMQAGRRALLAARERISIAARTVGSPLRPPRMAAL